MAEPKGPSAASRDEAKTSVLDASGIGWKTRERTILGPLDVSVQTGECLAIVGPNGAGKTTLLRLLTGLVPPSTGELRFRGTPYAKIGRRPLARHLAYVPQSRPMNVPLTVEEVVLLGRYPHLSFAQLAPGGQDFAAVEAALGEVEIGHLRKRRVDELSGGERQAAFIAAALAQESEVLILDEPTNHLDPKHQREVAALLERLHATGSRTVIVATHDLNFASLIADRIIALRDGAVLAEGTPDEMIRPEALARLFDAPFEVMQVDGRPVTLVRLDASGQQGSTRQDSAPTGEEAR